MDIREQIVNCDTHFANDQIEAILALGLVELDKDQSLPPNIYANDRDYKVGLGTQQEMKRKGWRKIEKGKK